MSDIGIIVAGAIGGWGATLGKKPRRSIGSTSDGDAAMLVANVTIEESHHDELEITDHPVERGSNISDHAYKRPNEVTVLVAWSNSTTPPKSLLGGLSGALTNKLTGTIVNQITGKASKAIGGSAVGNLAVGALGKLISNPLISFGAQLNNGVGKGTSTVQDIYDSILKLQASMQPLTVYTGKRKYLDMLIKSITTETDIKTENALVCRITLRQVIIVNTSLTQTAVAAPTAQANPAKTNPLSNLGTKSLVDAALNKTLQLGQTLASVFPTGALPNFPGKSLVIGVLTH